MNIEQKQIRQMEVYLHAVISITGWLRKANRNLDGIQDTIRIYERIEVLAQRVDMVMFKLE